MEIDAIDDQILSLLNKRAKLSLKVLEKKKQLQIAISDPEREAEIIGRLNINHEGPLSDGAISRIYQTLLAEMRLMMERSS